MRPGKSCTAAIALSMLIAFGVSTSAFAAGGPSSFGADRFVNDEPPSDFFPGKYFRAKAQFYLHKKDYQTALRMFEQSGFWADKIAQYNVGIMYFNGIGISMDRPRGVAWLRIAAEDHDDLAEKALQLASGTLSSDELAAADRLGPELEAKYGDAVAVKRALRRYGFAVSGVTGSHLGFVGNLSISETGDPSGQAQSGTTYYAEVNKQRDALVSRITGHVTVGQVQALAVDPAATSNASRTPVNPLPSQP